MRALGRTGLMVGPLGFGTGAVGELGLDEHEAGRATPPSARWAHAQRPGGAHMARAPAGPDHTGAA